MFVRWFYMQPPIASGQIIGAHGTDVSVGIRLLSGETVLQAKNSTGSRWDLHPGPCRQHDHWCMRANHCATQPYLLIHLTFLLIYEHHHYNLLLLPQFPQKLAFINFQISSRKQTLLYCACSSFIIAKFWQEFLKPHLIMQDDVASCQ